MAHTKPMANIAQRVKFDDRGLVPVVIQDVDNGEVLMLAYMNADSLAKTLETGRTYFWSRSRQTLWMKGETSGHVQAVHEIRLDCDADTILIKVHQTGVACHTGNRSCFFEQVPIRTESPSGRAPTPT